MTARVLSGPEFKYPFDNCTLGQFFFDNAEKYSDRICQINGTTDQSETYASVKLRSTRVAMAMQKKGITSKHVISFCSANTLDNTIPILATFYLGAKVANLEESLSVRHTKHLLSLVTPRLIFIEESALNLIEESLVDAQFETEIVLLDKSTNSKYSSLADFLLPQENEERFQPVEIDVNDGSLILFSSGTTGLPKAITHSSRSFLHVTLQSLQSGINCGTVFHLSTFYWMTPYMMITSCFKLGFSRIFTQSNNIETIFKMIQKYKIAYMFLAPNLSYNFTNFTSSNKYDTSSLKNIVCAGSTMSVTQLQKMNELFPSAITVLVCGMSEIGVVAGFDLENEKELARKKPNTCGRPGAGLQLKIVDPDTKELLGPNQRGEIRLKGPSLMIGYYNGDASTVFDKEGFLKTGDVGCYDEDGCVTVIERIREMFKYKSFHVIPSSLEAVLLEHPAVKEAVVFGIPHVEDGDVPSACVVIKEGYSLTEEEIDAFMIGKVADRERFRGGVTFIDVLPRTPTGKIVRKEVRDFVIKSKNTHKNI